MVFLFNSTFGIILDTLNRLKEHNCPGNWTCWGFDGTATYGTIIIKLWLSTCVDMCNGGVSVTMNSDRNGKEETKRRRRRMLQSKDINWRTIYCLLDTCGVVVFLTKDQNPFHSFFFVQRDRWGRGGVKFTIRGLWWALKHELDQIKFM